MKNTRGFLAAGFAAGACAAMAALKLAARIIASNPSCFVGLIPPPCDPELAPEPTSEGPRSDGILSESATEPAASFGESAAGGLPMKDTLRHDLRERFIDSQGGNRDAARCGNGRDVTPD